MQDLLQQKYMLSKKSWWKQCKLRKTFLLASIFTLYFSDYHTVHFNTNLGTDASYIQLKFTHISLKFTSNSLQTCCKIRWMETTDAIEPSEKIPWRIFHNVLCLPKIREPESPGACWFNNSIAYKYRISFKLNWRILRYRNISNYSWSSINYSWAHI